MSSFLLESLRKTLRDRSGFTLVEALVAVTLLTIVAVLASQATFQVLGLQRYWLQDMGAVRELRHAGSVFAGDALNTVTSTLVDLDPPVNTVALHWTDVAGTGHVATYSLSGTTTPYELERDFDGLQSRLARRVESVAFSRSGRTITFTMESQASGTSTKSTTLTTFLRFAQE